jgi:simple sugar transport system substrate-binding protein
MKKLLVIITSLLILSTFAYANAQKEQAGAAGKQKTIVMVVKLEGVAWFDNMRLGITAFGKDYPDINAYQTGAATADPAAQAKIIEDLTAKGVNAILAVPNDPASLVSVFKRANDAGIITLTHEASVQQQVSYDVEAFDNTAYGKHMMDVMAKWLGTSGMWQPFVGHLTSTTHNQWVDGEIEQAKAMYPGFKTATDRVEEQENQQISHDKTLELLKTYPDLKALMGSAMSTVPGAAQAITEKGLIGKVAAFGTCLPSVAGDYIKSGAVVSIHFWVPADAGYVTARAAYELLKGNKVKEGMNLGKPGYEKITIKNNPSGVPVIYGAAWVDVNKDNLKDWVGSDGKYKL